MNDKDASLLGEIDGNSQLLSAAIGASISGIIVTDWLRDDNPIIYCNRAFEEMTGYIRNEIVGKNCRFLQAGDNDQIGLHKLRDALSVEKDCQVELANYRKDGTVFYNELYIAPIKNSNGKVTHYVGIQNDITIRRQKEISLQLELSNGKKLQQQKDEFTSLASHELRTPVTSLRATLQLMNRIISEEPDVNDRLVTLSQNAERHTKKLSLLVDDLLITTLLGQDELILNKSNFTFSDLIQSCCAHVLMSGTHFITNIGDQSVTIYADQYRIDQVMINLIDNAVRFAPQSKEITVNLEQIDYSTKISVTDQGIGITEEQLPNIFLRYKRGNDKLADQSGFGLGLYICSEIIRQHGGEIGVESKPGEGSTFWFTLPVSTISN